MAFHQVLDTYLTEIEVLKLKFSLIHKKWDVFPPVFPLHIL